MFASLSKKPLWLNILVALAIVALLVFLFFNSLAFFTKHDQVIAVPNVVGKSFDAAKESLEKEGFDVVIQDSVYRDTAQALAVVKQFPEADASVKVNRTIYLTVNRAIPPDVVMPNLIGMSIRNATLVLKQFGLKMGDTSYKPDFAKNSVLSQEVKGVKVEPGTKLPMGTAVSIVLGSGLSNVDMAVPDLVGLTYKDATSMLDGTGINFGATVLDPDVKDTSGAYIYRQSPDHLTVDYRPNRIRSGQMIDIWLSTAKPVRDTTRKQPATTPEENNY
ncbi:MAG TPA: PASTA domain-containing protein [Flavihumibacter sp.]|nr:PASTA domain-containing protein [Flavihumibacter sp.]HPZ87790.1 PASTA domain-containing protein [Flavihumibacter sp.]HQD10025.1 PASTA domain-containing protein [Flavihumibacter sp.]